MKNKKVLEHKKNSTERKNVRNSVAGILTVMILLGGTFAWQAFDQEAGNEFYGSSPSPGARLHDDYNGSNKDVYIENYLTAEQGGDDIFVRIRIDEYLEYGDGAGVMYEEDMIRSDAMVVVRGDYQRNEEVIPNIYDTSTWDTYLPKEYREDDIQGDTIRNYRTLNFGARKYYLPTFNKNSGNEDADINGTMAGEDEDRFSEDKYLDYNAYSQGSQVYGDEVYAITEGIDVPENAVINGDGTYTLKNVLHTVKLTGGATERPSSVSSYVITMDDWLDLDYEDKKGNYWVYDENGWAYWAAPLESMTATDVLLDEVVETKAIPGAAWYYSINVVAEMATAGDWGLAEAETLEDKGMYNEITKNGLALLNHISNQVSIDIQVMDGYYNSFINDAAAIYLNDSLDIVYTLEVLDGLDVEEEKGIEWSVVYQSGGGSVRDASACLDTSLSASNHIVKFTPNLDGMIGNVYRIMISSTTNTDMNAYVDVTVVDAATMSIEDVEFELHYAVE